MHRRCQEWGSLLLSYSATMHTGLCAIRSAILPSRLEQRGWGERDAALQAGADDDARSLKERNARRRPEPDGDLSDVSAARRHELWRRHGGLAAPRHRAAAALDR